MLRKLLFFSMVLFLVGGFLNSTIFEEVFAAPVVVAEDLEQNFLGATVRISMYAPLTDAHGNAQYVQADGERRIQLTVNEGLATMTRQHDEALIITHDHWPLLTPDLRRVQFHDAAGDLLLEVSGEQFLPLVRYQDGGTLVLTAPKWLAGHLEHVPLGNGENAGRNDIVYAVHRQPQDGRLDVVAMLVQGETSYKGKPVLDLTSLNGEVVTEGKGSSGGGVLFNGELVGNIWGTVLVTRVSRSSSRDTATIRQTNYMMVAQLQRAAITVLGEATDTTTSRRVESAISELAPLSLKFVDGAIAALSRGWSGMSDAERETFLQIYDPAGTGEVDEHFVVQVLENYRKIRRALSAGMPVVYAQQSDLCEGQRLYYTDLARLYVCPHFFEEENELRKARTLIHEMTHKALLVSDRAYYRPTSKQYAELTPNGSWVTGLPLIGRCLREILRGDTLYHPDAYAHFALLNAGYSNIYAPGAVTLAVSQRGETARENGRRAHH